MKKSDYSPSYYCLSIYYCLILMVLMSMPLAAYGKLISKPFEYSGYTRESFANATKESMYVPMADETLVAIDIYFPAEFIPTEDEPTPPETFPAIMEYTPYNRAYVDPLNGVIYDLFNPSGTTGRLGLYLVKYGYVVVSASMRGHGASFGNTQGFERQVWEDGKFIINYLASQPWSNGNIGMIGGSFTGYSQHFVAGQMPPALKAIMPAVTFFDCYSDLAYIGGIYTKAITDTWIQLMDLKNLNPFIPDVTIDVLAPAAPVKCIDVDMDSKCDPDFKLDINLDEDCDGLLYDEYPLDVDQDGLFIDDIPPSYFDGQSRLLHLYFGATSDHLSKVNLTELLQITRFRDDPVFFTEETSCDRITPNIWPETIAQAGIAYYGWGGWFDGYTRSTTLWAQTLAQRSFSKMTILPIFHNRPNPYYEFFGMDTSTYAQQYETETLRFMDRFLKGIQNGIDQEPRVLIYVMNGEGFRFENEWPLKRQVLKNFYFRADNKLSKHKTNPNQGGSDNYQIQFGHANIFYSSDPWSEPYDNLANRFTNAAGSGAPDEVMQRTDIDQLCLNYTTEPLNKDTEVTGHPIIRFWVSSTADYSDFMVYLEDVAPDGTVYYVTEGALRAGFAGLKDNNDEIMPASSTTDVKPDLPWHGFGRDDFVGSLDDPEVPGILANGNIVELVFDLLPVSWVFKAGHSIRVSIAAADIGTYQLHPRLCSDPYNPASCVNPAPTITVFRDQIRPSHIELPIIPNEGAQDENK